MTGLQTVEQLKLNVVKQRSTLQRIELVNCFRHLARRQTMYRLKKKFVGTPGIMLESGWRVTARMKPMHRHDFPRRV
jgi:hypothetical protein